MKDLNPAYSFDIFNDIFLQFLRRDIALKVRVYLYRALNLSAQSNFIDLHHRLAGLQALCTANPYPQLIVGTGQSQVGQNLSKKITDKLLVQKNTLNADFFKMYELDAELPSDWKLQIRIWDEAGFGTDTLIGATLIDLEDRLFGQPNIKQQLAYEVYRDHLDSLIAENKYNLEKERQIEAWQTESRELTNEMDKFEKEFKMLPVEYLALRNIGKQATSQGSIELLIEPFPYDIAALIPITQIEKPQPLQFEIRHLITIVFV